MFGADTLNPKPGISDRLAWPQGHYCYCSCGRDQPGCLCPSAASETPEVCCRAPPRTKMKKAPERCTWSLDHFILTPVPSRGPGSLHQTAAAHLAPTVGSRQGWAAGSLGLNNKPMISCLTHLFVTFPASSSVTLRTPELPLSPSLSHPESLPDPPVARELHSSDETGPSLTPEPCSPLLHPVPICVPLDLWLQAIGIGAYVSSHCLLRALQASWSTLEHILSHEGGGGALA